MRAREFVRDFEGIDISFEIQKDDEYVDDDDSDNQIVYVTASRGGKELGHVLFTMSYDGQGLILNPQDLEVDERFQGQGIAAAMYDYVKSRGYRIRRSGQQTDAGAAFWQKNRPGQNIWESQRRLPPAIEEFLDSLNPDDCGVEDIGAYRIHFEGFTSDCKSSADYRRNPEAVYQQVYQDFIRREGGQKPLVQDMVGDERFPILYSIFRRRQKVAEDAKGLKKIDQILTQKGYKKLGSGSYQTAYLEPGTGLVLKIFDSNAPNQKTFLTFYNFCQKNKNNPFLPKFHGYETFEIDGKKYLQIRQEQLFDSNDQVRRSISQIADETEDSDFTWKQFKKAYADTDIPKTILQSVNDQQAELLTKTIQSLFHIGNKLGYNWDLRWINLLTRKDGSPVIVDPWDTSAANEAQEFVQESDIKTATARQVLNYINQTHHEPFRPGEKMYQAVMAHPRWQLQRVPLLNLYIPDQEYDDVDYDDQEPDADPYGRVMTVEPGHAGEISQNLVDRYPIVIDSDRYIIDGNHRAWAAKYLLNRDYIQAWTPV